MVTKLTNQVIKYLVYGLIVYTLFSYVPQKQLPVTDIIFVFRFFRNIAEHFVKKIRVSFTLICLFEG